MKRTMKTACLAALLAAPGLAGAQLFKCTQPDGKVVYSDARCEAGPAKAAAPAPAATATAGGRYQLTDADRDRIRNLEVSAGALGASAEQKTAANLEMSSIRSGQDARLTADQRARRDSLNADLASADAKKRREALNALREIYSN